MVPPPGRRALRPAVGPGTVLAGRYRLERPLPHAVGDPADLLQRWQAVDDVLARPVSVLLLPAGGRRAAAARSLLEAAAAAGTVVSPVLAQVYDAALEEVSAERNGRPSGTVDVAYVVSEQVKGPTLAQVLAADGPLEPDDASSLTLRAAEALREAHARGVVHGNLHPGTIVLTDGGIKLLDTAVGAALDRGQRTAPPDPQDDVRALAACLYAMLTGRWPEPATDAPGGDLPPAPSVAGRDGRVCSPRQLRAAVPRALDGVVQRALGTAPAGRGAVDTAAALVTALQRAADADTAVHPPPPRPRRTPRLPEPVRRRLPLVGVAALLVVVGVVSYLSGLTLGTVQRPPTELETLVESTPSAVPGGEGGQRLDLVAAGVRVTAFDPPPGDGRENDGAVPNAVDGDATTAWGTERYDSAAFGGLKQGVGLLIDLGQPTAVQQVEVGLRPGGNVELRAADELGPDAGAFPVVASVADSGPVARLVPGEPVTARYFLVWLTGLPADGNRFQGSINELFFVQP